MIQFVVKYPSEFFLFPQFSPVKIPDIHHAKPRSSLWIHPPAAAAPGRSQRYCLMDMDSFFPYWMKQEATRLFPIWAIAAGQMDLVCRYSQPATKLKRNTPAEWAATSVVGPMWYSQNGQ